jgi:Mn-dependent DtxR family transcriptional regulator
MPYRFGLASGGVGVGPRPDRAGLRPRSGTVFNPFVMPPRPAPSQTAEDYLERIHELIEEKGYARVVDIASSLKVRQASVTSMVQKLGEAGYLKYEKYRGLILTDQGREVAQRIRNRHETLSRFFSLFDLDAETQRADIEGIEHYLSPATVEILDDLARFFEKHPALLRQFQQGRPARSKKAAGASSSRGRAQEE